MTLRLADKKTSYLFFSVFVSVVSSFTSPFFFFFLIFFVFLTVVPFVFFSVCVSVFVVSAAYTEPINVNPIITAKHAASSRFTIVPSFLTLVLPSHLHTW
jgi:hypothetical protein